MILPVRRLLSPPSPRGMSTSQRSFPAVRRACRSVCEQRRAPLRKQGRRWLVLLLVVAATACNDPFRANPPPSTETAGPLAGANTAPNLLPSPPPGRAVATVPSSGLGTSSMQPIVVRGDEPRAVG